MYLFLYLNGIMNILDNTEHKTFVFININFLLNMLKVITTIFSFHSPVSYVHVLYNMLNMSCVQMHAQ